MQITSTNFENHEPIPQDFSKDGGNKNPALTFSEIPEDAASLALIVEDPDAPGGTFAHWILYNMSPGTLQIVEGELPVSGTQGRNDFGSMQYDGPQPPSGNHRYVFKLIALDCMIEATPNMDRNTFYKTIEGHVIDQAELTGTCRAKPAL